jgi:ribosome-associated protein
MARHDQGVRDLGCHDRRVRDNDREPVLREVAVRDDGIRLGQLLKLADLVETGADGKALLQAGAVLVNGEVEVRRGRQLTLGDVVQVADQTVRLV